MGDSAEVSEAVSSSPPSAPPPPAPAKSKAHRLQWTDRRLATLLRLRLEKYGGLFSRNNSRAQMTILWKKIRDAFNAKHPVNATVDQLKNKFNAAKALYGQIKADEVATGNAETAIQYPSYWPQLVQYFGDKKGLRNQDFGQSGVPLPPLAATASDSECEAASEEESEVESDSSEEDEMHSHEDAVASELKRHDAMRKKRKMDLPEALVAMGSSLASALSAPDTSESNTSVMEQLVEIKKTQQHMVDVLEQTQKVNAALLAYLTGNTTEK